MRIAKSWQISVTKHLNIWPDKVASVCQALYVIMSFPNRDTEYWS